MSVRDIPDPVPGDRALVRVAQAGICGTDLKIASGAVPVTRPRVLGHEMTGWVERPGARGAVLAGTAVLVNPALFCGRCRPVPPGPAAAVPVRRPARPGLRRRASPTWWRWTKPACTPSRPGAADEAGAVLQVLSTCVHGQSWLHPVPAATPRWSLAWGWLACCTCSCCGPAASGIIAGHPRRPWKREPGPAHAAPPWWRHPDDAARLVAAVDRRAGARTSRSSAPAPRPTLAQAMRLAARGDGPGVRHHDAGGRPARGRRQAPRRAPVIRAGTAADLRLVPQGTDDPQPPAARPRDCDLAIRLAAERRLELEPLVTARFPL